MKLPAILSSGNEEEGDGPKKEELWEALATGALNGGMRFDSEGISYVTLGGVTRVLELGTGTSMLELQSAVEGVENGTPSDDEILGGIERGM